MAAEKPMFSEANKRIRKILFSMRLNVPTEPITESDMRNLMISLRKRDDRFKKCVQFMSPDKSSVMIHHPKDDRSVEMAQGSVSYTEPVKLDRHSFNGISKHLYEHYLTAKNIGLDQVKLVGKVYFLAFDVDPPAVDWLCRRMDIFNGFTRNFLEVRSTLVEEDMNIHLYVSAKNDEGEPAQSIKVRFDVNNHNQDDGIDDHTFGRVIDFADEFAKTRLLDLLETNFGGQS